jgi:hypothetical protein
MSVSYHLCRGGESAEQAEPPFLYQAAIWSIPLSVLAYRKNSVARIDL